MSISKKELVEHIAAIVETIEEAKGQVSTAAGEVMATGKASKMLATITPALSTVQKTLNDYADALEVDEE